MSPFSTPGLVSFFDEFEAYPFSEDADFRAGLPTVLAAIKASRKERGAAEIDEMIGRAQWFYFTKLKNTPIPWEQYVAHTSAHDTILHKNPLPFSSPKSNPGQTMGFASPPLASASAPGPGSGSSSSSRLDSTSPPSSHSHSHSHSLAQIQSQTQASEDGTQPHERVHALSNTHAQGLATLENLAEARRIMLDQQAEGSGSGTRSGAASRKASLEAGPGSRSGSGSAGAGPGPSRKSSESAAFGDVPDFATVLRLISENRAGEVPVKQIPDGVNDAPASASTLSSRPKPWEANNHSFNQQYPPIPSLDLQTPAPQFGAPPPPPPQTHSQAPYDHYVQPLDQPHLSPMFSRNMPHPPKLGSGNIGTSQQGYPQQQYQQWQQYTVDPNLDRIGQSYSHGCKNPNPAWTYANYHSISDSNPQSQSQYQPPPPPLSGSQTHPPFSQDASFTPQSPSMDLRRPSFPMQPQAHPYQPQIQPGIDLSGLYDPLQANMAIPNPIAYFGQTPSHAQSLPSDTISPTIMSTSPPKPNFNLHPVSGLYDPPTQMPYMRSNESVDPDVRPGMGMTSQGMMNTQYTYLADQASMNAENIAHVQR